MSGLEGCISKSSVIFDKETDNRDIRQGLKNCISLESRISISEKEAEEERIAKAIAIPKSFDTLVSEIREEMGENVEQENPERITDEKNGIDGARTEEHEIDREER